MKHIPTDQQCVAALESLEQAEKFIQGYNYENVRVVKDLRKPENEQVLWSGHDREEMIERRDIERMRVALEAAQKALERFKNS